jgi:hypothetical protein
MPFTSLASSATRSIYPSVSSSTSVQIGADGDASLLLLPLLPKQAAPQQLALDSLATHHPPFLSRSLLWQLAGECSSELVLLVVT